jgi:N-methylhydantoinase A
LSFAIGIDIGGTFTDCVAVDEDAAAELMIGKAPSTPPQFEDGVAAALEAVAKGCQLELESFLAATKAIYHGCTVGTNALVEGRTAKVGLIATRGHSDAIFIMQAGGRLRWQPADYVANRAAQSKPPPLVPKELCAEVDERIAVDGTEVVALNEASVVAAIDRLLDRGVEAFAVALLWSSVNPAHELRIRELILERAPGAFVSVSSEVARRPGEYERTVATVINSLVGPEMTAYLDRLDGRLSDCGYSGPLRIMTCYGGLISLEHARALPVLTIGSGPVAGLIASAGLERRSGEARADIITADMGGTTLDVAVIHDGTPIDRATASYGQYEYFVPTHDVRSVGAGGGSVLWFDGETLKVGPRSAGAHPGPACYGRGGSAPTVTDADLVLGLLGADSFLGGRLRVDVAAARRALETVGAELGFSVEETAAAAARIVESQMADAIRVETIQQGYDVRTFTMYAYGGAGPVHATALAAELGIRRVLVPLGNFASGWSALGVGTSDAVVVREAGVRMKSPFDPVAMNETWAALESEALATLTEQGIAEGDVSLRRLVEMRFSMQVNEVQVDAPGGSYDDGSVADLVARFETEYERLFGAGSGYPDAGFMLSGMRVRASGKVGGGVIEAASWSPAAGRDAAKGQRDVYRSDRGRYEPVDVYDGGALRGSVAGPALIEYEDTTVVLRPGDSGRTTGTGFLVDVAPLAGGAAA